MTRHNTKTNTTIATSLAIITIVIIDGGEVTFDYTTSSTTYRGTLSRANFDTMIANEISRAN
jgi:hypothetical protein